MRLYRAARLRADGALAAACVALALACSLTACTSSSHRAQEQHSSGPAATPIPSATSSASGGRHPASATGSKLGGKTVPPPVPGNIYQTVPSRKVVTRPAVSLRSAAYFNSSVSARLTAVRSIQATAHGPGEISGPAVELSVRITNNGKKSIDLSNVVVNLTDAAGAPGLTIAGEPAESFRGSLAAGHSATGRYVFTVPTHERAPVSITISYVATQPVVLFVGNAS